jgi:D-glycero-alpha-D-manno-heptose-7-phosphate kinase
VIISRTPFRVSFLGGGTDYPVWYRKHGGSVLATTINKYCYITCRHLPPFFEHRIRLVYSRIENCRTVDEIRHPSIREVVRYLGIERGIEVHHDGDLPARCGMGSSSSFTVGLLHALHALKGEMASPKQLMSESIHIEQDLLKETVGSQDQTLAAHGGLNHIQFHRSGEISVQPVVVSQERADELNSHLMLFYTTIKRTSSDIAKSFVEDLEEKKAQMRIMNHLVKEGLGVLGGGGDITSFGELLDEAWQIKRKLSAKTSNAAVDGMYDRARASGAIGGKLTGAGGGGFMLLFVPPARQDEVKAALSDLIHVPFDIEPFGSRIIFYGSEADYSAEDELQRPAPVFRELSDVVGETSEERAERTRQQVEAGDPWADENN